MVAEENTIALKLEDVMSCSHLCRFAHPSCREPVALVEETSAEDEDEEDDWEDISRIDLYFYADDVSQLEFEMGAKTERGLD